MLSPKRAVRIALPYPALIASTLVVACAAVLSILAISGAETVDAEESVYGDGVYDVGFDIEPGTYVSGDFRETCYVQLVDYQIVRRNFAFVGRAVLTIRETDVEFYSTACGFWELKSADNEDEPVSEFGSGTFEIGVDIEPGIYVGSENDGRCFWYTVDDFTFVFTAQTEPEIIWWRQGSPIAVIDEDDTGFYSARCGSWIKVPEEELGGRTREFTNGSYLVGLEIVPGTYESDGGDAECTWLRIAPFTSQLGDHSGGYASHGPQIVTILKSDYGFYAVGCGEWHPQSMDGEEFPHDRIGDGTYLVGTDIEPGTYVAESRDGGFCRWLTLSGFTGRQRDVSASGVGVARGIVSLRPDAGGFTSTGCEEWTQVPDELNADATTTFGEGEYVVGHHVAPGIYTSPGARAGRCLWRRLSDFTGSSGETIATRNSVGKVIAQIEEGDAGFEAYRCGTWTPFELTSSDSVATEFGIGTWAIHAEVAPGTYVAEVPQGSQCFWSRISAFTGESDDFISTDTTPNHAVMTLNESDAGVYSDGCGTWNLVTDYDPVTSQGEITDGVYIVGRDVAPGTYTATRQGQGQCFWSRVTSFTGDLYERPAVYGASGRAIVTIKDDDVGFRTWNCGTWKPFPEPSQEIVSSFSDGTYAVGVDIAPGTYEIRAAPVVCRWRRLSDFTWNEGVLADVRDSGRVIVEVLETDVGFSSKDCGTWEPLEARENTETAPFAAGANVVGSEIAPGTYVSVPWPTNRCEWERVSSFTGDDSAVIADGSSEGQSIVTISETDVGFITRDCRAWGLISDDQESEPSTTIKDGVYRVGLDIAPGTYETDIGEAIYRKGEFVPACSWQRLSGFSHEYEHALGSGFAHGEHTVTIEPTDVGLASENCGEWQLVAPPGS